MKDANKKQRFLSNTLGLYIHIPFCIKKCAYCDFNSYDNMAFLIDDYLNAVLKEIRINKESLDINIRTLYISGGTPTFLIIKQLNDFFSELYSIINKNALEEITIEANPETINEEKVKLLKSHVNRISLGVQSFSNGFLKKLGRIHTAGKAYSAAEIIKKHISNFSIDLIYGMPDEKKEDVFSDIKKTIGLSPKHISFYMLTVYHNTKYFDMLQAKSITLPDDEEIEGIYLDRSEERR